MRVLNLLRLGCLVIASGRERKLHAEGLAEHHLHKIEVSEIRLEVSDGCLICCATGDCDKAFQDSEGVCCPDEKQRERGVFSCCPIAMNGKRVQCHESKVDVFECPWVAPPTTKGPPATLPPVTPSAKGPPAVLPVATVAPVIDPPRSTSAPPMWLPAQTTAAAPASTPRLAPTTSPAPSPANEVCNRQTGIHCNGRSCPGDVGPMNCQNVGGVIGSICVCQAGYCGYNGKCLQSGHCSKITPGRCRLMGCFSSRGAVDCRAGQCECKSSACAVDGVCYEQCEKGVGTCAVNGCNEKTSTCEDGACLCGQDDCSWKGQCFSGKASTNVSMSKELAMLSDPRALEGYYLLSKGSLLAASMGVLLVTWGMVIYRGRRMSPTSTSEPLLYAEVATCRGNI